LLQPLAELLEAFCFLLVFCQFDAVSFCIAGGLSFLCFRLLLPLLPLEALSSFCSSVNLTLWKQKLCISICGLDAAGGASPPFGRRSIREWEQKLCILNHAADAAGGPSPPFGLGSI
jgi:hypothetical protein